MEKRTDILKQAMDCYRALDRFRKDRERNKMYHFGNQWPERDIEAGYLGDEHTIRASGCEPLKNNLIRRLVRNVIGVYKSQARTPHCVARNPKYADTGEAMTRLLRCNGELNRIPALNLRSLEEFLISGLVVHRKWYGTMRGRTDCWTEIVHANNFFVDASMLDIRGWDCCCIGEVHDITLGTLIARFGKNAATAQMLRKIYAEIAEQNADLALQDEFGYSSSVVTNSFLRSRSGNLCRVIEIWRKEWVKDSATAKMSEVWKYYFLSPSADVLASGITPYAHGEHPYVMKAYPLIDGEIHSFVADVIDQQRYTNRLITIYDWLLRSSAKGLLMIPEECIPRGCTVRDFADAWSRFNGVLVYRPSSHGDVPRQVSANSTNVGITEMLNIQLKFFEDISGVHPALEGKVSSGNISGNLYGQQTENATLSLADVLSTFSEFVRDGACKDMSNIRQFYDEKRLSAIVGDDGKTLLQSGVGMKDVEYDLNLTSVMNTASMRNANNEMLMRLYEKGDVPLEAMLEAGDFSFATALLNKLKHNTEES